YRLAHDRCQPELPWASMAYEEQLDESWSAFFSRKVQHLVEEEDPFVQAMIMVGVHADNEQGIAASRHAATLIGDAFRGWSSEPCFPPASRGLLRPIPFLSDYRFVP